MRHPRRFALTALAAAACLLLAAGCRSRVERLRDQAYQAAAARDFRGALQLYADAIAIAPAAAPVTIELYQHRAHCYRILGHTDAALADFDTALRLAADQHIPPADPRRQAIHRARAPLHELARRYPDAIADYSAVAEASQDPDDLNNLAWLLVTCPDTSQHDAARALPLADRAVADSDHQIPAYIDTLAAAQARAGAYAAAVESQRQAIVLLGPQPDPEELADYASRLHLYTSRQPYIEPLPGAP